MGYRQQITVGSGINLVLGIWLIISPFLLGHSDVSFWNQIIVGLIIAVLAAIRAFGAYDAPWMSWVNVALGIWLIISPWVLGYSVVASALWNDVIVGVLVIVLGAWSAMASPVRR